MNETMRVIMNRRTTRKYLPEPVSREDIDAILEAGYHAPSGHNHQSWHFTVVQNAELLAELNEAGKEAGKSIPLEDIQKMCNNPAFNMFYDASTIIVVSGMDQGLTPREDCAAATQNMLLAAESMGLGACWNGMVGPLFRSEKGAMYIEKLGIPKGFTPFYVVALGHTNSHPTKAPARRANVVNYVL